MLYRPTDRLSRRGAPAEYLAHSASFHSLVNDAPSKPGIKHLAEMARSVLPDADVRSVADFPTFAGIRQWLAR